jgi:hypothetical protein
LEPSPSVVLEAVVVCRWLVLEPSLSVSVGFGADAVGRSWSRLHRSFLRLLPFTVGLSWSRRRRSVWNLSSSASLAVVGWLSVFPGAVVGRSFGCHPWSVMEPSLSVVSEAVIVGRSWSRRCLLVVELSLVGLELCRSVLEMSFQLVFLSVRF